MPLRMGVWYIPDQNGWLLICCLPLTAAISDRVVVHTHWLHNWFSLILLFKQEITQKRLTISGGSRFIHLGEHTLKGGPHLLERRGAGLKFKLLTFFGIVSQKLLKRYRNQISNPQCLNWKQYTSFVASKLIIIVTCSFQFRNNEQLKILVSYEYEINLLVQSYKTTVDYLITMIIK